VHAIPQEEPTVGAQLLGIATGRDRLPDIPATMSISATPNSRRSTSLALPWALSFRCPPVGQPANIELLTWLRTGLGGPLTDHDLNAWQSDMETGRDVHVVERDAFARAQFAIDRRRLEQAERDLADGRFWTTPVELARETDPSKPPTRTGRHRRL